jgi:hypothetical protein
LSTWRDDIEELAVAAITGEDVERNGAAPILKLVKAVGQITSDDLDESGILRVPFALVRYQGADGELEAGGKHLTTAHFEVLVAALQYSSVDARRVSVYEIMDIVQDALMGVSLAAGLHPCVWRGDVPGGIEEESGVELWQVNFDIVMRLEGSE